MKYHIPSIIVILLILSTRTLSAQENPSTLTIDRIFNSREFASERFGPARWMEDGKSYTTLENSTDFEDFFDIIKYDSETGSREILVNAKDLVPDGENEPLKISNYEWSSNKELLLVFTNTQRVWRRHTRGDYWVLNLNSGKLKQLGVKFEEASLMFTKFSPDNSRVGYVSKHNIYVENLDNGEIVAITTDGTTTLINGTFDWAYEEEFGCRDGFRWSPDSKSIAYWQLDASNIRNFLMINNTDSTYSFTVPIQYPKVGEDPSSCRIGVVSASGGETTWIPVPGDNVQNYLPRMMWSPDAKKVLSQQLNRKQNTNRLWLYDVKSGDIKNVYTDLDEAWVDVVDDWIWLKGGKEFTWLSEKDGWKHFYRVRTDGSGEQLVTDGTYDVVNIVEIDDTNGYVYFIASPENPTQRYLYRVALNGKGELQLLSPESQQGTHSYEVGPEGKYAFHTFSNINTPPVIELVSLPEHKVQQTLVTNDKLKSNLAPVSRELVEFFKVTTIDDVEMDGYIIRPPGFNPDQKYPVVFYVYGEPAGQTARDGWGAASMWHLMLAQQGYIVISMDNRGTPSPKGREWRKSIYRKIGVLNSHDQAMAAMEVLKWDFVDPERIATWGWSGGGSMTLNLLFRYPEIYKTGMSVAPVSNQLNYDNIYQERYMGVPWENMEDFVEGSPITYAKNLEGDLLLVHGTGDDNVHYQNAEMLMNELILNNKMFQTMPYPNRTHGIREGQNTTRHLYTLLTKYLNDHITPGGKELKIQIR